jgi:hypothetical protein
MEKTAPKGATNIPWIIDKYIGFGKWQRKFRRTAR